MNENKNKSYIWIEKTGKALALCVPATALSIALVVVLYEASLKTPIDFLTILSMILAFFSIGLSAVFYFSATKTSNKFYKKTFTYSKQISELLVKMDGVISTKLDSINKGVDHQTEYLHNHFLSRKNSIEKVEAEKLEDEKEVEKAQKDKDQIIEELLRKSKIDETEKGELKKRLETAENNLNEKRQNLFFLEKRLDKIKQNNVLIKNKPQDYRKFLNDFVIKELRNYVRSTPKELFYNKENIRVYWDNSSEFLSEYSFKKLMKYGFITNNFNLTEKGCDLIISIYRDETLIDYGEAF